MNKVIIEFNNGRDALTIDGVVSINEDCLYTVVRQINESEICIKKDIISIMFKVKEK